MAPTSETKCPFCGAVIREGDDFVAISDRVQAHAFCVFDQAPVCGKRRANADALRKWVAWADSSGPGRASAG